MKKVFIIAFSFSDIGGIEKVCNDIYNVLVNNLKIDTKKIAVNNFNLSEFFGKKIIIYKPLLSIPKVKKFMKKFFINKLIEIEKFDLIICGHPFLLKNINKNYYKKTLVWTYGIDVWGKNGIYVQQELKSVRKIITISSFTKYRLIKDLGINEDNIEIVPVCVDTNKFKFKPIRKKLPFILLTVGRLDAKERYKGHDLVIKALALLKNKNLNIIYNIIGDGSDRKRLEKLAKDLKVDTQVNFLGKASFDEIKQAYHNCHLFIMPSFYSIKPDGYATGEGFGIVYLEAGASGRAVIGCHVGGQTDYIRDGINGLLVNPDPKDIAQKIEFLYGKFDLLEEMGKNGRKIVEEKFSMERFERDLKNLLENIINVDKI